MNISYTLIAVLSVWLTATPSAFAHRVDEYLQATRLSIDLDRADVEMDLTAGTALAARVFGWIDTDRDGKISSTEGEAYALLVLHSVVLKVDGSTVPVTLVQTSSPEFREMREGIGTIRLRATAKIPPAGAGHHEVSFLNTHQPESSVYLVNALVPASARIQLGEQRRDMAQHGLTLQYMVTADASSPADRTFTVLVVLAIGGYLLLRFGYAWIFRTATVLERTTELPN